MQMPQALTQMTQSIQWPFLIGVVIAAGALLTAIRKIVDAGKALAAPLRQFLSEHDVLWEDYNLRTGGSYRRSTGRGSPPDPEEFYRDDDDDDKPPLKLTR
jgi:hypothetical protein